MGRTCIVDSGIQQYIESIADINGWNIGLIIGQAWRCFSYRNVEISTAPLQQRHVNLLFHCYSVKVKSVGRQGQNQL